MRTLLIVLVLVFVALPYEAQLFIISLIRPLWLTTNGQALLAGLLGASLGVMVWYAAGWNALADRIYADDIAKANQSLAQRRRGR